MIYVCTAGCTAVQYRALVVVDSEEEFYLEEAEVEAVWVTGVLPGVFFAVRSAAGGGQRGGVLCGGGGQAVPGRVATRLGPPGLRGVVQRRHHAQDEVL